MLKESEAEINRLRGENSLLLDKLKNCENELLQCRQELHVAGLSKKELQAELRALADESTM